MTKLMPNQIRAKTYIVGRALLREEWWEMSAEEANEWCIAKVKTLGDITDEEAEMVADMAMGYAIQQVGPSPEY